MSSPIRDCVEEYESIGRRLNDFLYKESVKKGIKEEHTKEELEQELETIRQICWENYNEYRYSVLGQSS